MKYLLTVCLTFVLSVNFAQNSRSISTYLLWQYNKPFLERHIKNNPWGIGLGTETFFLTNKKIQPAIDFEGNFFVEKAQVSQSFGSSAKAPDIGSNISLLAGISIHPIRRLYFSFVAGPTLVNKKIYLSIKPSIGFYLDKERKWASKLSGFVINKYVPVKQVFNGTSQKESIGYFQVSLGHRLF